MAEIVKLCHSDAMVTRPNTAGDDLLAQVEALGRLVDERNDVVGLIDRAAVLRETSHRIRANTGADLGYTAELDGPDLLVIRGWAGANGAGLRNLEVPRGLGLGGKSFALERPAWVPDYCSSSTITHDFDPVIREEGIGAMVAVPLIHEGVVLGVAYAALRETADIGDIVMDQMTTIAGPAATALCLADRVACQTDSALAAERRRIAVSLHDSVGAMLFSLGAEVHDLQSDPLTDPELLIRLRTVEQRIAETAAMFRESLAVLDEVRPDRMLTAALREDCEAFTRRTGVPARCLALTDIPPLDAARRGAIVAVVREALVNVEKHARASSVVVSIVATDGGIAAAVADDGLGWPDAADAAHTADALPPHATAQGGIGLRASYDRLERLGGALSVVGNDDGGLTVRAWVPVPDAP